MKLSRRELLTGLAAAGAAAAVPSPAEARDRKVAEAGSVGMLYDSTLCIGCRACVVKCKEANQLPQDRATLNGAPYDAPPDLNGTTKNVIKLAAAGGRSAFMKSQCMHCVDPACVSVCMIGALAKNASTGIVTYDKDGCVGCRYCQVACPFNVPKFNWDKAAPQIVKCELCRHRGEPKKPGVRQIADPACCEVCPRGAVVYGKRSDLLQEAQRRLKTQPDRYEAKVYGDQDAGGTQVLYLTAKGVPFRALGLPDVGDEAAPALSESISHGIYYGMVAPVALFGAALLTIRKNRKQADEEGA
ncbi:MAG: hydrogenase 2 operon protein HybA [Deltaproteobacteria bacterium]|nr:hydrogenase 2 operon protein HybA [Deltaproteobacteria bacterium]